MRAWAEMFNAFLSTWSAPAPTPRPTPTPTTSPTSTASPATTACATCSRRAASGLPDGDPSDPPDADTVCGLGNRKNDAFNVVLERDGVTPYPGSVALLDLLRDLGMPLAVVSSSANAPAVLAAAGLADRFVTVVDGRVATDARAARQAGPRHLRPRRHASAARPRPARSSSRTPSPGCGPAPPAASGSSSASTAGPAPTPSRPPGPTSSSPTSETSREAPPGLGRPARPQPVPGRPVAPRRVRPRPQRPRRHRDPVHRRQRLHRDARQPRGGPRTRSSTAPTSTGSTRPGRSGTPRRPTASPAPARRSSTPPTPS